ncbi:MAG: hypothetical protein GY951_13795 [Psychromonas sp.]|nr:hypothetical protein [Psychromonas sp.]
MIGYNREAMTNCFEQFVERSNCVVAPILSSITLLYGAYSGNTMDKCQ